MSDNCSDCIHNEVCKIQDRYYEIQRMCQEADLKYDDISVDFHCKHYWERLVPKTRTLEYVNMPTTP